MNNEKKYVNFEDVIKSTLNKGHKYTAAKFEAEKYKIVVPSHDEQKEIAKSYAASIGKVIGDDNKLADRKSANENATINKSSETEKKSKPQKTENELLKSCEEMIAEIDANAKIKKAKVLERIDKINERIRAKKDKNLDRNAYLGEMFFEVYGAQLGETHETMKNFVLSLCKDNAAKERVNTVQFFDRRISKNKKKTDDKNA